MNEEINTIVYKIIMRLLEIDKSDAQRSDISIEINDVEENEIQSERVGKYEVVKLADNKKIFKLSIFGKRVNESFQISEIERYDYIKDTYSSFRRDELYSQELTNNLEEDLLNI